MNQIVESLPSVVCSEAITRLRDMAEHCLRDMTEHLNDLSELLEQQMNRQVVV